MRSIYRARKRVRLTGTARWQWMPWVWIDNPQRQGRFYDEVEVWCHYSERYVDISVAAGCKK